VRDLAEDGLFNYLGTYQTEEEAAKAPNDPNAQGRKKHGEMQYLKM
jgi:hypothetical protein